MPLTGFAPSITFLENAVNAAPQLLDSDVAFTSATSLAGGRLVVSGLLAEDRVSVLNEGGGAGQIGVSGASISFGGTVFGTLAGGSGNDAVISFNAAATGAAVDALIQRLAYGNISDEPTLTRTLTVDVVDGAGAGLGVGIGTLAALSGTANPFNDIDVGVNSAPAFLDLDGDGDLDLVAGAISGALLAFRNTGPASAPVFTALSGTANPFDGIDVGFNSTPAFLDLDGDGDLDLVSGEYFGTLLAWRNTGPSSAPVFTALSGSDNPFNDIDVGVNSAPAFLDLDGDGDLDLVSGESNGMLRAFRNTGPASAPVFTALTGTANPFNGIDVGFGSTPAFLDLDGDGDLDLVSGERNGTLLAWRNTGTASAPVFTALSGTANPFNGIDVGDRSTPAFLDLDGDGDRDLVSGESDGRLPAFRNTPLLPAITVTVTPEDDGPVITSGKAADAPENTAGTVYSAIATSKAGPVTWTLSGTDAALFSIGLETGALSFRAAPDFEAPADDGKNNIYNLTINASDGKLSNGQDIAITVTDVPGITVDGGAGNDNLTASPEDDLLRGFASNDTLTGGAGNDTMEGGPGNDRYIVQDPGDVVTELPNAGIDQVDTSIDWTLGANLENLFYTGTGDFTGIGNSLANRIWGADGNDLLRGGAGRDSLYGGAGDDTIEGGGDSNLLNGGDGFDLVSYAGVSQGVSVFLTSSTTRAGGRVLDTISAFEGAIGGNGDDSFGGSAGANRFEGGNGADTLRGAAGDDTLDGGAGDDQLIGGLGADVLKGGAGMDFFVFTAADFERGLYDVVTDIHAGGTLDWFAITGVERTGFLTVEYQGGVVVTLPEIGFGLDGGGIYIENATLDDFWGRLFIY